MSVEEVLAEYCPEEIRIDEPCVLIRIQRRWRRGMAQEEIYQTTRACWKLNWRRAERARYVLSISHGIIRAVFTVQEWKPCHRQTGKDLGR